MRQAASRPVFSVYRALFFFLFFFNPVGAPFKVGPALAAEVVYDDAAAANGQGLQNAPDWAPVLAGTPAGLLPGSTDDPSASGNTVTVDYDPANGGKIPGFVFGGLSQSENVQDNIVRILRGQVSGSVFGGYTGQGNVINNTVSISNGISNVAIENVGNNIIYNGYFGGYTGQGDVINNIVSILNGISNVAIEDVSSNNIIYNGYFGGYSGRGNVMNNTVSISNITANLVVTTTSVRAYNGFFGGVAATGDAVNNTLSISNSTLATATQSIGANNGFFGGYAWDGNAVNNTVSISNATLSTLLQSSGSYNGVLGGFSRIGDARNNTVSISNTTLSLLLGEENNLVANGHANIAGVMGGVAYGEGKDNIPGNGGAIGNVVRLSNVALTTVSTYRSGIFGGLVFSGTGNVENNTVSLYDVQFTVSPSINAESYFGGIFGGGTNGTGNATNNTVNILNGTFASSAVYTNYSGIFGGASSGGSAMYNTVNIAGEVAGSANGRFYAGIAGGFSGSGSAMYNTVNIAGDVALVANGNSNISVEAPVLATNRSYAGIVGGFSGSGNAMYNTVNIAGDVVLVAESTATQEGGSGVFGGLSEAGGAENNVVNLSGVSIFANASGNNAISGVVGGYAGGGDAVNNTVSLSDVEVWADGQHSGIYGGFSRSGNAVDNTVILSGQILFGPGLTIAGGESLSGRDAFSGNTLEVLNPVTSTAGTVKNFEYYKFVLPNTAGSATPMLAANVITLGTEKAPSEISLTGVASGGQGPVVGDRFIVLHGTERLEGEFTAGQVTGVWKGISLALDFSVFQEGNNVLAVVDAARVNPQTKAFSEGRAAGQALLRQGGDLAEGAGLRAALSAGKGAGGNWTAFAALDSDISRYDTGSHVDANGVSLLTGLALGNEFPEGRLTLGVFFEAGRGTYNSHNSFSGAASVKGKGDAQYYGGGLLGRWDFPGGFYTEGSVRVGYAKVDFRSGDFEASGNRRSVDYDSGSLYRGVHAGVGQIWHISEKSSLDFSFKYLWMHQEGDSVNAGGDPLRFNDSYSSRVRGGARYSYAVNEIFEPYAGAYYEYEFDGRAKASVYGYSVDTVSLGGGTGIGEVGFTLRPSAGSPFQIGLQARGYTGVRQGVSGSLQFQYEF